MTLTLVITKQSFPKILWLLVMYLYHYATFGYKRFNSLEDTIQANIQ